MGSSLTYQTTSFAYAAFFGGIAGIVFWVFLIDQTMLWRKRFICW